MTEIYEQQNKPDVYFIKKHKKINIIYVGQIKTPKDHTWPMGHMFDIPAGTAKQIHFTACKESRHPALNQTDRALPLKTPKSLLLCQIGIMRARNELAQQPFIYFFPKNFHVLPHKLPECSKMDLNLKKKKKNPAE